jgi:hypothetical protein
MTFNFVADSIVRNKAYPALATWKAIPWTTEWRRFSGEWPHTVPVNLHDYCEHHNYPYQLHTLDDFPPGSFYTIAPVFFYFDLDYIGLLPANIKQQLFNRDLKLLFYYDEADNPYKIKQRLDQLCIQHELPVDCYQFISANTAADQIENFASFSADELLYWDRNQTVTATPIHQNRRARDFTVLSRTHKWWRATVMTDLYTRGLLENSFWSYNTNIKIDDVMSDSPIDINGIFSCYINKFLSNGPYVCDTLSESDHNNHGRLVPEHYSQSYCSIILETHIDADQSGGSFLTEKTFKAIKHGHPFVIVGTPGSLAQLKSLGYRTFDHAIDPSYDSITDVNQRWLRIAEIITDLKSQDLHAWFEQCRADVEHNQQLFLESKYNRLNTLHDKLLHQLATS